MNTTPRISAYQSDFDNNAQKFHQHPRGDDELPQQVGVLGKNVIKRGRQLDVLKIAQEISQYYRDNPIAQRRFDVDYEGLVHNPKNPFLDPDEHITFTI